MTDTLSSKFTLGSAIVVGMSSYVVDHLSDIAKTASFVGGALLVLINIFIGILTALNKLSERRRLRIEEAIKAAELHDIEARHGGG